MRKASAIAEHHPEELFARNKSLLDMTHEQLHDFSDTPEAGLPEHKGSLRKAAERKRNG